MPLYFKNPGLVDMRALTIFGVNAKENDSPIGFFGTGFKMGTGVVLRSGGNVIVHRGMDRYEFFSREDSIRGKQFGIVCLRHPDGRVDELGFTTEVGKNWEPWMAYREFRCNSMDENGSLPTFTPLRPEPGTTIVEIHSREVELAHENADNYFLSGDPMLELESVNVHYLEEPDTKLFFRGIKVGELRHPSLYRYNVTRGVMLTEDRTVANGYAVENSIRNSIALATDEPFLEKVLAPASHESFEAKISFTGCHSASEMFLNVAERVIKQKPQNYNLSLRDILHRLRNFDPYEWVDPTVMEAKMLLKAENACKELGFDTTFADIRIVDHLGGDVLGQVHGNQIYLSRRVFQMGTKMVAGTLFEEMIHLRHGLLDETRTLQNYLIDKILTMHEEKSGEPL